MKRHIVLAAVVAAAVSLLTGPFAGRSSQNTLSLPTTGVFSGLTEQNNINNALDALLTCNSGSSAPTNQLGGAPKEGQCWLDTTSTTLKVMKRYTGSAWVVEAVLDVTNGIWSPPVGGGQGNVASAGTTDLCASPQAVQTVSGTTTITSFGSNCAVGVRKTLIFAGAVTLTYNATSMIIPSAASYTTSASDVVEAVYQGSGNWLVINIARANGQAVVNPAVPTGTALYGFYPVAPAKYAFGTGQALSRASFPDYLAAVTLAQNVTATSGNNTLTSVPSTAGMGSGMPVEGTCVSAGTTISSVTGSTIVMSANAITNGTCSVTVFFTGYGSGGSSSTVGVPDCRDAVIAGRGDMGGTDRGLLTSNANGFGGNPKQVNASGGGENVVMASGNLIQHLHSNTLTDPGHIHTSPGIYLQNGVGGLLQGTVSGAGYSSVGINSNTTGITINNANAGSASPTAMRTQPFTLIANCIVRTQAMNLPAPANDDAPVARGRQPTAIARRFA